MEKNVLSKNGVSFKWYDKEMNVSDIRMCKYIRLTDYGELHKTLFCEFSQYGCDMKMTFMFTTSYNSEQIYASV